MSRPEWRTLAAREDESALDYHQRLQRAGLHFRTQVMRPGKSIADTLQDMLGITAAEAAAIPERIPTDAAPGLGDCAAGAAAALPGPPTGRCANERMHYVEGGCSQWSKMPIDRSKRSSANHQGRHTAAVQCSCLKGCMCQGVHDVKESIIIAKAVDCQAQ